MSAAQGVCFVSPNINDFVAFCFDDESTHGLAEMTDTVMGFSRCNRHGLLASALVLSI